MKNEFSLGWKKTTHIICIEAICKWKSTGLKIVSWLCKIIILFLSNLISDEENEKKTAEKIEKFINRQIK